MGDPLGIPEWLAATGFVVTGLLLWFIVGFIVIGRGRKRLAAKREDPTRDEFVTLLSDSVEADIALWLWDKTLLYYDPLKPHPDDHLIKDAMVDDDDISMDWWPDFAKAQGLDKRLWPDWPSDWELTIRNYARWLQLARDQQTQPTQRQIPAGI